MKKYQRFLAVACTFLMVASFSGCASTGILPPQYIGNERQSYGRIGSVVARYQPQVAIMLKELFLLLPQRTLL
jgi:hypothetical protein